MIDFIIVDDDPTILEIVEKYIYGEMLNNKMKYKISLFSKYNDEFYKKVITNDTYKIYIFDVDVHGKSGIDISRKIRESDMISPIIIITAHVDQALIAVQEIYQILSFINKYDHFQNKVTNAIKHALALKGTKNFLKFHCDGNDYSFELNDILYIEKLKGTKYCIIHTIFLNVKWKINLDEIVEYLTDDFIRVHKSCLINKNHTIIISKSKKIIKFDNGEIIDMISDIYDDTQI